jgi:hypothetical protein
MKKMTENFKNFLFVIVLLCFASNIFATDSKPSLKIVTSEKKIFTLIAEDTKNTLLTIRIFDEQGINLLKEKVVLDNNHSRSYDLSNLPKGIYEIEIEDNFSFRKYIVTNTSNDLKIKENDEEKIYKPVVKLEDNFILFNMLNLNSGDVSFAINNDAGEEIYVENIQNTQTIHKGYNLSNLPSGRYLIAVKTSSKVFNVEVNLK